MTYASASKNPVVARYMKFAVSLGVAFIEVANLWAGGPKWIYAVAPVVASFLVMAVPNAPEYKDPRMNR
jgi:hypothetical protein